MALIINFMGPPGTGKSTGATYLFSMLKMRGIKAEYVNEVAKDKVWEGSDFARAHQEYIFGEQSFKIACCAKSVDVVITDSPLLLSIFYNKFDILGESFNQTVLNVFNSYNNKVYFIERVKEYNPVGRKQTEEESDLIGKQLKDLLNKYEIEYKSTTGDIDGYNDILRDVLNTISKGV